MDVHGQRYEVGYWPGDSKSGMFGGNSNWRGPICESNWALQSFDLTGYGDRARDQFPAHRELAKVLSILWRRSSGNAFRYMSRILWLILFLQVECPTGSGDYMNLASVAEEIQHRIIHIFGRDMEGRRATNGGNAKLDYDPHFRDYVWFHEVSIYCCNICGCSFHLSFSTPTTDADSVRRTKQGGQVLSRTISCRVVSAADCQKHRGVSWFDYCGCT